MVVETYGPHSHPGGALCSTSERWRSPSNSRSSTGSTRGSKACGRRPARATRWSTGPPRSFGRWTPKRKASCSAGLDFDDGETYRIGRLVVRDGLEPLLIDWRAPAAAPFYRATSGEPLGVVRRRVIICRGPQVVDLDDDVLSPDDAGDLRVLGEGALLAALRRSLLATPRT
jgi:hypothetical protein